MRRSYTRVRPAGGAASAGEVAPAKRGRGRPRKLLATAAMASTARASSAKSASADGNLVKRQRGRPPKKATVVAEVEGCAGRSSPSATVKQARLSGHSSAAAGPAMAAAVAGGVMLKVGRSQSAAGVEHGKLTRACADSVESRRGSPPSKAGIKHGKRDWSSAGVARRKWSHLQSAAGVQLRLGKRKRDGLVSVEAVERKRDRSPSTQMTRLKATAEAGQDEEGARDGGVLEEGSGQRRSCRDKKQVVFYGTEMFVSASEPDGNNRRNSVQPPEREQVGQSDCASCVAAADHVIEEVVGGAVSTGTSVLLWSMSAVSSRLSLHTVKRRTMHLLRGVLLLCGLL